MNQTSYLTHTFWAWPSPAGGAARLPTPARHHHGTAGDGPDGPLHGHQDGHIAVASWSKM